MNTFLDSANVSNYLKSIFAWKRSCTISFELQMPQISLVALWAGLTKLYQGKGTFQPSNDCYSFYYPLNFLTFFIFNELQLFCDCITTLIILLCSRHLWHKISMHVNSYPGSFVLKIKFLWNYHSFLIFTISPFRLWKIPQFHQISWCGNFVERHSFRIVSGESPATMLKLCLTTKCPHQEIR